MRPSCAANPQERISASSGTKLQRGLELLPTTKWTQVLFPDQPPIIHRRSLFSFPAQLTDNNLALLTGKKGSGHPKDQDQSTPQCPSTGEEASSPSMRQASRVGAPATTFCKASNHGRRAPQAHAFVLDCDLLMTQDPHNILFQRERGGRETLCPTCDSRKAKHSRTACHRQAP